MQASRRSNLRPRLAVSLLAAAVMAAAVPMWAAARGDRPVGQVFALDNNAARNQVVTFDRFADGRLQSARTFATGGRGSGGGLGNQGALALSDSGNWLLAVNPGSNSVSVFYVFNGYLLRTHDIGSGGVRPVSVTIEDDLVYVLNAGSDTLQGFRLGIYGRLTPIAGSGRPLSGSGTGAAQVEFNRDGDLVAVTEKATNRVLTFAVNGDGRLGTARVQDSPAPTPFGFAFGRRDQMFVSEAAGGAAGASTLSAYQLAADGSAGVVSAAVPSGQSAACWVVVTRDGGLAFVSNTASGNLSTYLIEDDGMTVLGEAVAGTTGDGSGPTDMALDRDDRFLYALNAANGTISAFQVGDDGRLQLIEHQASQLLAGAPTGLVAR